MLKPDSLRIHITAALPDLARDPERLRMWIDRGSIRSRQTASLAFQYGYRLNVVVLDWTLSPSIIFILLVDWLRRNQPDLVASQSAPGFTFEADILDTRAMDLSIELDLTETVSTVAREGGGFDLQHHAEPVPMFPDDVELAPALTELWLGTDRVIPGPAD